MSDSDTTDRPTPDAEHAPEADDDEFFDWGGDGSDLSEPVRAHVLAALVPTDQPYAPPVADLLTLGNAREKDVVERRKRLPIGQEQLGELLRMARDRGLHSLDDEGDPALWGPVHAGELLSEIDLTPLLDEVIPLFDLESDWLMSSLPRAFGRVGAPAIGPLRAYLADRTRWAWGHTTAINSLEELAKAHPEQRDEVVALLSDLLREAAERPEPVATGAMSALVELRAVEALPLIRRAFELEQVDEMMRGDYGMVLKDLGVEPEPGDPLVAASQRRHQAMHAAAFPAALRDLGAQGDIGAPSAGGKNAGKERARKAKNKRKAAANSKKANRKKKRK
jgi:hypothetical protein